jgi:Spy/CpxP family protein refolding chaperone
MLVIAAGLAGAACRTADAQAPRAKERIEMFKKMKMLDFLDLDEKSSEKFLIKYNAGENKIENLREQFSDALKDLRYALRKEKDEEELEKLSSKIIDLQQKVDQAVINKAKSIKEVLSAEEFSRYLLFEAKFHKELRDAIFHRGRKMMRDRRPPRPGR